MSVKIFVAFTIVSISSMFPNNAFMNAHEYFYYKLRNVTEDDGDLNGTMRRSFLEEESVTPMQAEFEAYLTVFGGIACVLGSVLNVFATKILSNTCRVMWGHALVLLVFVPTIALTYINLDQNQDLFFNVSMLLISIACFGSLGMMAGGVLGLSALFPAKYTQAVMVGQSISGVLAAVLSIVCQAATSDMVLNGRIYFGICVGWTILSVFVYLYLTTITPPACEEEYSRLVDNESENSDDFRPDEERMREEVRNHGQDAQESMRSELNSGQTSTWQQYGMVFRQSGIDLTTISVVLLVTLAAYPGLTSLVKSTSRNHTWNSYFSAVCSFTLYNICDLIGRSSANALRLPRKWLLAIACLRFVLIPLIALCNIAPRAHTHALLPYDGVFVLLVFLLAVSHGFCITNATIGATNSISEENRELAGSVTSLIGVTAAMVGGVLGVLVLKLI